MELKVFFRQVEFDMYINFLSIEFKYVLAWIYKSEFH